MKFEGSQDIVIERREVIATIRHDDNGVLPMVTAALRACEEYILEHANTNSSVSVEFVHDANRFRLTVDPIEIPTK